MPTFRSAFATGRVPVPNDSSGNLVALRADFAASATMRDITDTLRTNFANNDVIEMFDLPPGHVIDDLVLISDDIDSATGCQLAVGFINATDNGLLTDAASGGAAMIAASAIGQTATIVRPTTVATWRVQPSESTARRRVGVHVVAAPTTLVAGTISLVARLRSVHSPVNT